MSVSVNFSAKLATGLFFLVATASAQDLPAFKGSRASLGAEPIRQSTASISEAVVAPSEPSPTISQRYALPGSAEAAVELKAQTARTEFLIYDNSSFDPTYIATYGITTSYDFGITRGFAKDWYLTGGVGYGSATYENNFIRPSSGMKDFALAVTGVSEREYFTAVYGLRTNISPSRRVEPTSSTNGNMFSGNIGLQPFVGFEALAAGGVIGAELSASGAIDGMPSRNAANQTDYATWLIATTGFYQFALSRSTDIGVEVTFGKDSGSIGGNEGYSFTHADLGVFAGYHVGTDLTVLGNAKSQSVTRGGNVLTTAVANIGLRKTLQ